MNRIANRRHLSMYAKDLLGNDWSPQKEKALAKECLTGFVRGPGHISHSQAAHLSRIDKILGTCGVEGMLLNEEGEDVSGTCDPSQVHLSIQYCNAGDAYAMTIAYVNGSLRICDWGSLVEALA